VAGGQGPYLRPQDPLKPGRLTFRLGPADVVEEMSVSVLVRALGPMAGVRATLELSADRGGTWRELGRFAPEEEHDTNHMWFNHRMQGAALKGEDTRLRVSVAGAGLEKVIANSAVRAQPRSSSVLKVTHRWREDGQVRSSTWTTRAGKDPDEYQITTGPGKLQNESLRLETAPAN
jgi:hypothetical protein